MQRKENARLDDIHVFYICFCFCFLLTAYCIVDLSLYECMRSHRNFPILPHRTAQKAQPIGIFLFLFLFHNSLHSTVVIFHFFFVLCKGMSKDRQSIYKESLQTQDVASKKKKKNTATLLHFVQKKMNESNESFDAFLFGRLETSLCTRSFEDRVNMLQNICIHQSWWKQKKNFVCILESPPTSNRFHCHVLCDPYFLFICVEVYVIIRSIRCGANRIWQRLARLMRILRTKTEHKWFFHIFFFFDIATTAPNT